ncbi:MAG: hypothetical protein HFJ48_01665, partial [Clostridia bacterium]|nr:hypothetical protein [Clostridia bacterium]
MNKELEEAIERLKIMIESIKEFGIFHAVTDEDQHAIETVLQALYNSISKEVIKEKKQELEKEYKEYLEENSTKAFILKCQLELINEMLEEE